METSLTTTESRQLANLESVIESGLKTFAEVGNALLSIRDGKLYRASHGTFEAYCKERWGFNASRARQLIGAAIIVDNIKCVTTVTPPQSERQARPLSRLAPAEQPEAWQQATERAESEGRKVTARDVETVVEERKNPTETRRGIIDPLDDGKQPKAVETYSSETIAGLKRYWKQATKKEKKEFLAWTKGKI